MSLADIIKQEKLIAILRGIPSDQIVDLAEALYAGGIRLIEVTFDQKAADPQDTVKGIAEISSKMKGRVRVGAGTVLSKEQVRLAAEAGAEYIISPDTNREVIEETKRLGLLSMPGAMTPSEIASAYRFGADFVKVFPCSNLGPSYIKAVSAPLSHIPLIAVGGVKPENEKDFLNAGACGVGAAGNMVNKEWLKNREFDKITEVAKQFVDGLK